jgi:hypothetical protein
MMTMVGLYLWTFEKAKKYGFLKSPYHIEGRCVLGDFCMHG